jgi:isochorismate synthase
MKVFKDKVILFVGGGLTIGSDPEKEWAETRLKAQTLSKFFIK